MNHHGAASNETYQERLARLEGDKESLILQVGPFSWETAYPVTSASVGALSGREVQEVFFFPCWIYPAPEVYVF